MRTPEIIVALDFSSSDGMAPLLDQLPREVRFGKVGLELFTAEGPRALRLLRERDWRIFLDLKLHDIPHTAARAVRAAAAHGVDLLTVHAAGGRAMLEAAAEAAADIDGNRLQLVAVTTLTSLDEPDLREIGIERSLSAQALALAELALATGIDGVVTSVHEAPGLRERFGDGPLLVTPGIRLASDDTGDQKRVATPSMAVRAGATHLVIGRPITRAADPAAAARRLLADMRS